MEAEERNRTGIKNLKVEIKGKDRIYELEL
jgi:hypothetical protein